MRLPGDEAAGDQAVDQAGDVARADAERLGQHPLRARAALVQLVEQVRARHGQPRPCQGPGHVLAHQDDELQHLAECRASTFRVRHPGSFLIV
jgi:hypothetical protein